MRRAIAGSEAPRVLFRYIARAAWMAAFAGDRGAALCAFAIRAAVLAIGRCRTRAVRMSAFVLAWAVHENSFE